VSFFIGNQDKVLTNSPVHSINTRNKHHLLRPIVNLSCFQKGASYSGIWIFNNLPQNITSLRNEKPQFKVALKFFFICTLLFLCGWIFLHVQMICITDLYDCVNSHTVTILYVLFAFVCFLTCSTSYCLVTASGIHGMCVYIYIYIYICVCVCRNM